MPEAVNPKIDLTTFFFSISSAAFMAMTEQKDLALARQNIDLLELMADKTKGNRTPEEEKLLEHLLFETRMRFIDLQKGKTS